jgi:hypothetical protein
VKGFRSIHGLDVKANVELSGQHGEPVAQAWAHVGSSPSVRQNRGEERQIKSWCADFDAGDLLAAVVRSRVTLGSRSEGVRMRGLRPPEQGRGQRGFGGEGTRLLRNSLPARVKPATAVLMGHRGARCKGSFMIHALRLVGLTVDLSIP